MKTKDDGIDLINHKNHELDIAFISLRIGIEAYFSTYQPVRRYLDIVGLYPQKEWDGEEFNESDQQFVQTIHIENFSKAENSFTKVYLETILHFHHFIELTLKEILRKKKKWLDCKVAKDNEMLTKILAGEEITPNHKQREKLEFKGTIDVIKKLIEKGELKELHNNESFFDDQAGIILLNGLRNKIAHHGVFLDYYSNLDMIIGKDIFPFILILLNLPIYRNNKFKWQHKPLYCQINPIEELIKESQAPKSNYKKIALLKEMGRAAYKNPLSPKRVFEKISIEESAKRNLLNIPNDIVDILMCPVCGANTLQRHSDINQENEEEELTTLQCICCSFKINSELKEVNIDGLDIKTLWKWD